MGFLWPSVTNITARRRRDQLRHLVGEAKANIVFLVLKRAEGWVGM